MTGRRLHRQGVRGGLSVRQSTVRGAGDGLFAAVDVRRGDFLGFYTGTVYRRREDPPSRQADRCMALPGGSFVCATRADVIAYANEPPVGKRANSEYAQLAVPGTRRVAVGLYATETVKKGQEIFVHYGPGYNPARKELGYVPGLPARSLAPNEMHAWAEVTSAVPERAYKSAAGASR